MDQRTQQFLHDPIAPLLVRMSTPNTISFLTQAIVNLTEIWFIGQLGVTPLAAVALAFPLFMVNATMSGGAFGGAVNSAIARSLGSGQADRAERLLWHTIMLCAAGALCFLLLFLLFGRDLLVLLGGRDEIIDNALAYCHVVFLGGIFLWFNGGLQAVFRGMGNMRFPAVVTVTGSAVQIVLSAGLILGHFGFPKLGFLGAAVSPMVSAAFMSTVMVVALMGSNQAVKLRLSRFAFDSELFRDILQVFLPASISPLATAGTTLALTGLVGQFGTVALAGYGIGSRVEVMMIPLVFGIGTSMTAMVGANVGAKNIRRAERIGLIGGLSGAMLSGSIGIILAIFPAMWITLLTDDPATVLAATKYIQIVGPCYLFFGVGLCLYFASQGAKAMRWPIVAVGSRFLIVSCGGFVVSEWLFEGIEAVYIIAAAGMIVFGVMNALAVRGGAWRRANM